MTKNTTYTERFTIDFISKKIIGTQASFNKASKGTGEIYEELASKIARHPNFEVAVKEQKKHIRTPVVPSKSMDGPHSIK